MHRTIVAVVIVLTLAVLAGVRAARAEDRVRDSGVMLMLNCNVAVQDGRGPEAAMCIGYLLGMAEALAYSESPTMKRTFCFTGVVSPTQLAMSYTTWAQANPQALGAPRHVAAYRALREAYGCK